MEFPGKGTFTVTLDPATYVSPRLPPHYNQQVGYVTGKPRVVIDGADSSTFFTIFTLGRINAVNQALFPEGQVYDAEADVILVEVIDSTRNRGDATFKYGLQRKLRKGRFGCARISDRCVLNNRRH